MATVHVLATLCHSELTWFYMLFYLGGVPVLSGPPRCETCVVILAQHHRRCRAGAGGVGGVRHHELVAAANSVAKFGTGNNSQWLQESSLCLSHSVRGRPLVAAEVQDMIGAAADAGLFYHCTITHIFNHAAALSTGGAGAAAGGGGGVRHHGQGADATGASAQPARAPTRLLGKRRPQSQVCSKTMSEAA